jgi:succinate dehydrogenase / fumarate reductase cytochrome b subunit
MGISRKDRPKYLNLVRIRLPVTGVVSIIHRITGILLFLLLPIAVFSFEQSVQQAQYFAQVQTWLQSLGGKITLAVAAIALGHHLFAGIRFLIIDLGLGFSLSSARASAWTVFALDVIWAAVVVGMLR